jgi:RNA polymerase sigma-70 factor (ECF subfamily)
MVDERARENDPLREVMRGEKAEVVRRAIAKLPPKQRATLVLRVYQELTHEEIAGILGSSVGAVKANFFHALGNLKRILQTQ